MRTLCTAALCAAMFVPLAAQADWPSYGHDPGGQRYSPLTEITPQNVARLAVAWSFDTGFTDRSYQATPLVVGDTMYLTTPTEQVVALEADTGRHVWKYDPHEGRVRVNRGVSYWPGDGQHAPRVVLATSGDEIGRAHV